jgi:hypothetical protein
MKKKFLWVMAAILTCCLGMSSLTSCSNQDAPVLPPMVTETLTGDWLYVSESSYDDDEMVGKSVSYSLLSFDENGVITQRVYNGNTGTSIDYWDRWRRHGMYTVDKAAHTFTVEGLNQEPQIIGYTLTNGQLIINQLNEKDDELLTATLHRPEAAELMFLNIIDKSVWSDDYVGKWFSYSDWEDIGIRIYVMVEFTEDGIANVRRYSVDNHNDCMRTVFSQRYEDCDEDDDMKMLRMHDSKDYSQTYLYWWSVEGNTLILGDPEDSELNTSYHPLTRSDIALIEELDKLVKE